MDPVVEAIVGARVGLLFNQPFFGVLATRLELVDASKWCPTAAVDGKHLFYNREFVKGLTPEELQFLVCHEVLHCAYDHLGRRGGKHAILWNAANDYIVNATLIEQKVGAMPKGGLLDGKYTSTMTSEEVYRLLADQYGDGQSAKDKLGTLDQHLELGDDGADSKGKGKGKSKAGSGPDDGSVSEPQPHDGGRDPNGDPDPGSETGVDYTQHAPVYTEDEMAGLRNQMKAALINAIQSNTGNAPAGVKRLVEEFCNPTINWKELLTQSIQSTFKEDYTFARPSKRSWGLNGTVRCLLPGQSWGKTIDICISLDTSGSISNEIFTSFLSEVKGIVEQYEDFRLHIWCIDAAIYNPQVFTPENVCDLEEYQPAGGGGNDFPLNWSYMRDNDIEPELFVVFSDGYPCGSWGDPDYCDTIFVIRNDWDKTIEAPFGMTVYMED